LTDVKRFGAVIHKFAVELEKAAYPAVYVALKTKSVARFAVAMVKFATREPVKWTAAVHPLADRHKHVVETEKYVTWTSALHWVTAA